MFCVWLPSCSCFVLGGAHGQQVWLSAGGYCSILSLGRARIAQMSLGWSALESSTGVTVLQCVAVRCPLPLRIGPGNTAALKSHLTTEKRRQPVHAFCAHDDVRLSIVAIVRASS